MHIPFHFLIYLQRPSEATESQTVCNNFSSVLFGLKIQTQIFFSPSKFILSHFLKKIWICVALYTHHTMRLVYLYMLFTHISYHSKGIEKKNEKFMYECLNSLDTFFPMQMCTFLAVLGYHAHISFLLTKYLLIWKKKLQWNFTTST